jgi:hypothetical protein
MRYRCCFLNEADHVVRIEPTKSCGRIEELVSYDHDEARREAMFLLAKTGRFSGYELWRDRRKVDEFKMAIPPDPRTSEVETKLCGLAPVDELAYRYLLRDHSPHCRRDPGWKARIAEIEGRLDADGRAHARTLAADLTSTLVDKI